jgi:hypothetical protein
MRMLVDKFLDYDNNNIGTALQQAEIIELYQLMATTRADIDKMTIQRGQTDETTPLTRGDMRKLQLLIVWLQLQHQQNNYQALTEKQWQALSFDKFNEYRISFSFNIDLKAISTSYIKHCASLYYVAKTTTPTLRLELPDGEPMLPLTTTVQNDTNDLDSMPMGSNMSDSCQAQPTAPSLPTTDATSKNKSNNSNDNNTISLVSPTTDCYSAKSMPKLATESSSNLEPAYGNNFVSKSDQLAKLANVLRKISVEPHNTSLVVLASKVKPTQTHPIINICDVKSTTHKLNDNFVKPKRDSNNYDSIVTTNSIVYKLKSTISFTDLVFTVVNWIDTKWGDDPGMRNNCFEIWTYGTVTFGMIDKHADTQQFWPMLRSLLVWGVNLQPPGKIIDGNGRSKLMKVDKDNEEDTYAMVGSETQYY